MRVISQVWVMSLCVASTAQAQSVVVEDPDESEDLAPGRGDGLAQVDVHGFVSQGFLLTAGNDYLAADSTRGSFEFTEIGINFTTEPIERLRLGVQLFARDLGPIGNFQARFDWFYADYRFADWLGVRVGRTKLPFGLYNELNDIDAARTPILLPQSIYPVTSRDFLLAQTGVEVYGLVPLGDAGRIDYRVYGGTVFADFENTPGSPYQIADIRWPYLVGGRLLWESPLEGLRVGGSVQALRLETDFQLTEYTIQTDPTTMMDVVVPQTTSLTFTVPAVLWVASAEYATGDVLVAAEYSQWHASVESSDPTLYPDDDTVSQRLFGMLGYTLTEWFQASFYYSLIFPDMEDRRGRDSRQQDFALTARFDLNEHWLLKAEGHFMNGTAELSSALNDGVPNARLPRNWGVFLLKTTAYF